MKKVLLIACSLAFTSSIFSQEVNGTWKKFKETPESTLLTAKPNKNLRRETISDWYFPMFTGQGGLDGYYGSVSPNAAQISRFVGFLFPDSTVLNLANTSNTDPTIQTFGHTENSWGLIFDPMDDYIGLYGQTQLTQHQSYTWDSVQFNFGYVRQVDSMMVNGSMTEISDTMIIRYYSFQDAGISTGILINTQTRDTTGSFARPRSWNIAQGYAISNFDADTIVLDSSLATTRTSQGWGTRGVSLPVGKDINISSNTLANRLCGFTIHFKPMKPYSAGDTLIDLSDEWETNTPPVNRNNYLVSTFYSDANVSQAQIQKPLSDFTTSLRLNKFSRYSTSGWQGYVPGQAFTNNFYWLGGVHITSTNVSTQTLKDLGVTVGNPYPNPTGQQVVNIPVSTRSAMDVAVNVTDINGRTVYNSEININGQSQVSVDATGWASGIYNININIDGISTTKKLVVR